MVLFNILRLLRFILQGVSQSLKRPLFILELLFYFIGIYSLSIQLFFNMVVWRSLLHMLFDMACTILVKISTNTKKYIFNLYCNVLVINNYLKINNKKNELDEKEY